MCVCVCVRAGVCVCVCMCVCVPQLTGTMSHVLGQATLDASFQEERAQLLEGCQTSGDHFKAGLMSLTSGVFGGVTSMFTQPYKEVREYGIGVSRTL